MDHSKAKELLSDDLCFVVPELRLELCPTDHPDCEPEQIDIVQYLVSEEKLNQELAEAEKKIGAATTDDERDAAVQQKTAVSNRIFRYRRALFNPAADVSLYSLPSKVYRFFLKRTYTAKGDLRYFPPSVTRENVVRCVNDAARDQQLGFEIVQLRSTPPKKVKDEKLKGDSSKAQVAKILLGCTRGIKQRERIKKRSTDSTSTKPRTNDELCRHHFPVYERKHDGRMFIRRNGGCSWIHNHPSEHNARGGVRALPDQTRETVIELLSRGVTSAAIKEMVNVEAGIQLSDAAINSFKYQVDLSASNEGKGVPTATELLAELDARDDVDYVALKGSYDEALDKVRINKKRRTKKGGKVELDESGEVKDLGEEAEDSVKNVVKGLSLGDGEYLSKSFDVLFTEDICH